jgi:hypothetical protein
MPMPTFVASTHITTAQISAFHVKKNNAAIAPTWNAVIKATVTQLVPTWDLRPSLGIGRASVWGRDVAAGRGKLPGETAGLSAAGVAMGKPYPWGMKFVRAS